MKLLLLGKNGQVGWELQRSLSPLAEVIASGRGEVDLRDLVGLRRHVRAIVPDVIVNAAAYTAVDKAEVETQHAQRVNAEAVGVLAEESNRLNAWLVHYSTDYVFDGTKPAAYNESDQTNPLSQYGRTKLIGEQSIVQCQRKHLIFRTSWVYSVRGGNFAKTILRLGRERDELNVIADQRGAPTSAELVADVTALALRHVLNTEDGENLAGIYHLAAGGETTWHDYARYLIELAQLQNFPLRASAKAVHAIATEAYPLPAKRPQNSRLNTTKLKSAFSLGLPDWRYHVRRFVDELTVSAA